MSDPVPVVLDASVGVKWFRPHEAGSEQARGILADHAERRVRIVISAHGLAELLGTAVRYRGPDSGRAVWRMLRDADLTVVGLDDVVAEAAFVQCQLLGCCFYDALAPALATILGATLYSADVKAHGRFPGVVLLG